jgi:Ca2+-binding EF-hand superfamily protein
MTLKVIQTLSRCKAIDVGVLILQCGDADGAVQSLQSSQLSSPLSSSLRQLSNCNDDENIAVLFKKIDTDNDGLITFQELMTSLKYKEMQLFLRSVPSLAPFLNPQDIQQTIDPLLIRVDNENEDQLTQHTFTRLALAIINHMDIDVQTYKENAVKLDAIDQLFAIIDIDNDGVLSYATRTWFEEKDIFRSLTKTLSDNFRNWRERTETCRTCWRKIVEESTVRLSDSIHPVTSNSVNCPIPGSRIPDTITCY